MMKVKNYIYLLGFCIILLVTSCQQPGGNSTGSEYMPDMAHSIAYEANTYTYYYNNTWGTKDDYHRFAQPRKPVSGTIPRGYAGGAEFQQSSDNGVYIPANGHVPYHYMNTEPERERAIAEIINNPYPITDAGLERGKELFTYYCAICHGDKGDGAGYLVREDGGVYPVQPAILTNEEFTAASNGRFYHSIMYGKNLMGSYADKLGFEERWQVIHYIRSLQAAAIGAEYNQYNNTLNDVDKPAGEIAPQDITAEEQQHEMNPAEDSHGGSH